jgi:hypothetical protein
VAQVSATRRHLVTGAGLLAFGAALQVVSARHPTVVEMFYARSVFPVVQRTLSCLSARVAFSVGEAVLLTFVVAYAALALHMLRGRAPFRVRIFGLLSATTLAAGILYWGFLLVWGLNYAREPFGVSAGLDVRPASREELLTLSRALAEEANRAREETAEDASRVMRLRLGRNGALDMAPAGFEEAQRRQPLLAGRCSLPKRLLLSPFAARLGIAGIYFPFTGEPNVNTTVPDPELPFAASHEIAHQRGFAREDEANYLGYLACRLHPHADFRYSGLLSASVYAQSALYGADREAWDAIEKMRSPGVSRDLRALRAWSDRYQGPARAIAERVNDAYLKVQGQAGGRQSYGRVVDLLLAERRTAASAPTR